MESSYPRSSSQRVGLVTSLLGVLSNTLITISFVMLFAKYCLNDLPPHWSGFRKVKNEMYTKHADGFMSVQNQIFALLISPLNTSADTGRPVIATSRIDTYDGENVTFHYTRHEDNKTVTETIPALNFIQKLIVHIPEKHFKMLRYYGIYAKHHKQEMKLRNVFLPKNNVSYVLFRTGGNPFCSFGYDPLCCSECGTSMLVLEVYHKKTALFEQYRKVMKYG